MGEKHVTRDLIRNIGGQIEATTRNPLQNALQQIQEAQGVNIANYTAVSHWYASAYIGANEFVAQSWDTKITDATDIRNALNHLADNWDENEQASTIREN